MNYINPWIIQNHKINDGWLVDTSIKKSNIEGAGNGRFINETIGKGEIIRKNKIISTEKYTKINDTNLLIGKVFKSSKPSDLDTYFKTFDPQIIHFAWSSADENVYHFNPSNYINHSSKDNLDLLKIDNDIVLKTNRDIEKGEELYHNYKISEYPKWFTDYSKIHKVLTPIEMANTIDI